MNESNHFQDHDPSQQIDLLADLRAQRELEAQSSTERLLRNSLTTLDRVSDSRVLLTQAEVGGAKYDEMRLSPASLVAFDAVGLSASYMVSHTGEGEYRKTETIPDTVVDGILIEIEQLGNGISMRLESPEGQSAATATESLKARVSERFAQSPAHAEIHKLATKFAGSELPEQISTDWFDPSKDPLGSLSFLIDTGLAPDGARAVEYMRVGKHPLELVNEYLRQDTESSSRRTVTETAQETTYSWGSVIGRHLVVDHETGAWKYVLTSHPEQQYLEAANQSPGAETVPFIETDCARDMLSWASKNGLTLAPAIQYEMTRIGQADRFGSVYTQLSREIAKWVDNPSRIDVTNLFVPLEESDAYDADELPEDKDRAEVSSKLLAVNTDTMSTPAAVLFGIARQALQRDTMQSDLPVTKSQIDIKDGACFDVFSYYVGAAVGDERYFTNDWLNAIDVDGVTLLEKTYGIHTFLTTTEILFNGVKLPKGSLFQQAPDGGFAFQRLTPFAFENPEDQLVFGSEIAKTYQNEAEAIKKIGGVTISNLVIGAQR